MINLESEFSPRVNPADANYPFGSIKDNTSPGANDGTPLAAVWGNDWEGFAQAAMTEAGITPSGLPDTAQDSQLLDAVKAVASGALRPSVIEALRRSYAEAGYNLVLGSFKAGFTLINASDVALDEETGKAFSGAAGTYPAGTSTAGFVDRSGNLGIVSSTAFQEMINSPSLIAGQKFSTGGTTWKVVSAGGYPAGSKFVIPLNGVWVSDFVADSPDARIGIQQAIDVIEAIGRPLTIKASGEKFLLKSLHPAPPSSLKVGIIIAKPAFVRVDLGMAMVEFDVATPSVASSDCVLAIAPTTSGLSSNLDIQNASFSGGAWPNPAHRPKNVIKADFFTLRYGKMDNVEAYFSRESNILMAAFVMSIHKVRARFAGKDSSNFDLVVDDMSGVTGGARTGYLLENCTADYAGMHGYKFSGSNGHTYCALVNCYADHIGRTDQNVTIPENLLTSSAYRAENVRVLNLISCGVEVSTRPFSGVNCRTLSIDGLYTVDSGSTDGAVIDAAIKLEGFFEKVNISCFENRNAVSTFTKKLSLKNPAQSNINSVVIDASILRSEIEFEGGNPSSSPSLVMTLEDIYSNGVRRGDGDACVTGKPLTGRENENWFSQTSRSAKQTFIFQNSVSNATLLTVDNISVNGYIGFIVDVVIGKASGSSAVAPARFTGGAASHQSSAVVQPLILVSGPASYTVSIAWVGSMLVFSCSDDFSVSAIEVTAIGRPFSSTKTFQWA